MAAKKVSRAQKAVSGVKKKNTKSKSGGKSTSAKRERKEALVPGNIVAGVVSLALFVLFLIIAVNPDGVLVKAILSVLTGLLGKVAFYIAIPALFYLFVIHIFNAKTALRMRSACLISFVFLCGCIHHLIVRPNSFSGGFVFIAELYRGGVDGYAGGLLCGAIGELLHWACGDAISYIILALAAILTLLGSMQITIPSLIRAIKNRPRDDWEDEEEEEYVEPAAVVVNHIANKRIEHNRQRQFL